MKLFIPYPIPPPPPPPPPRRSSLSRSDVLPPLALKTKKIVLKMAKMLTNSTTPNPTRIPKNSLGQMAFCQVCRARKRLELAANTLVRLGGKVYSNSPSGETDMSPPLRVARVERSRRAWGREMPALVAMSLAMTAAPLLLSACRMTSSQAWITLASGGAATSSSLRIGRPLGPRICVNAEE